MNENSTNPPRPSMIKVILWTMLCLVMCFWAIIGSLFVVLAVISFFVDISPAAGLTLPNGEPVRTVQQKAMFLCIGLVIGLVGGGFLWLVRRGYLKEPV